MRWWTPRVQRHTFVAVVSLGLMTGLVLGIREANDDPVLEVGEPRVRVEGLEATIQVTVTNTSDDTTYCPDIGVAALDREGLDLDAATALPDSGDGTLAPRASANYVGVLSAITAQDFDEELDEYVAFVDEENPCP